MKSLLTAVLLAGFAASAAETPGFTIWKSAEIKGYTKTLTPKVKNGIISEPMANFGNYNFARVFRNSSGQAEVHDTMNDIFIIEGGEARLVTGGTVVDGKSTAPHETRGASITGGTETKVGPGDIMTVPAKLPHQMKLNPGQTITYVAIKVVQ
jgi:mannose-6-phosphate isomerase-like protein (cupin superfamily)